MLDAKNENTWLDNIEEGHLAVQEYEKTDTKANQIDVGFEQGDINTNDEHCQIEVVSQEEIVETIKTDNEEHQEDVIIKNEVEKPQIEDISPEENVKTIEMQEDVAIRYDLDEENNENKIQAKGKSFENDEDKECNTKLKDESIVEEITCTREEDEDDKESYFEEVSVKDLP